MIDKMTTERIEKANRCLLRVSNYTGVQVDDIVGSSRRRDINEARALLAWVLHSKLGYTTFEAGAIVRRKHATITHHVQLLNTTLDKDLKRKMADVARMCQEGGEQ